MWRMDFLLSHPNGNIFFLLSFRTRLHRVRNLLHRGADKKQISRVARNDSSGFTPPCRTPFGELFQTQMP